MENKDLDTIQERLKNMEEKAQKLVHQTEDLETKKGLLEEKVAKLDKELAQEKEKTMVSSIRSQEEKSLTLKVESNLKDIQERLRRDQRERDLETGRAKLEAQLKDVERKLAQEREIWVETLRTQMAKRGLDDQAIEERVLSRVREIESRFTQERLRLVGKIEERTRELEDLKKQALLEAENTHSSYEKKVSEAESQAKILEARVEELTAEIRDRDVLKEKLQRALQDQGELHKKLGSFRHALQGRDALLQRAKWAMAKLRQEREFLHGDDKERRDLKERILDLEVQLSRAKKDRLKILEAAKGKIRELLARTKDSHGQYNDQIEKLETQVRELEEQALRGAKELTALAQEKEFLMNEIDKKDKELARWALDSESFQRAAQQVPAMQQEIETLRQKNSRVENELTFVQAAQKELENLKQVYAKTTQDLESLTLGKNELEVACQQYQERVRLADVEISTRDQELDKLQGEARLWREEQSQWHQNVETARLEFWKSRRDSLREAFSSFGEVFKEKLSRLLGEAQEKETKLGRLETDSDSAQKELREVRQKFAKIEEAFKTALEAKKNAEEARSRLESENNRVKQLSQEYFLNYEKRIRLTNRDLENLKVKEQALLDEIERLKARPWARLTRLFKKGH